jgi:hypothetical protein
VKQYSDELFMFAVLGRRGKSGHYEKGCDFDLRHLRDGRKARASRKAHSGRPELAAEIMGASIELLSRLNRRAVRKFIRSVSYFWRALDAIETNDPTMPPVHCLRDLTDETWSRFCWHLNADAEVERKAVIYQECRRAVLAAFAAAGVAVELPDSWFAWNPASTRRSFEPPYSADLEARMMKAFRKERHRTERRLDEANRLADEGLPPAETLALIGPPVGWHRLAVFTPQNTLRFVRDELLRSIPDTDEFERLYGFQPPRIGLPPDAISIKRQVTVNPKSSVKKAFGSGLGLSALYRWFVPLQFDIIPFICELVHLDGFNLSPVLALDRKRWYLGDPASGSVTIVSRKARSGGQPLYVQSGTGPNSAYQIISRAIRLTQPLHDHVIGRLSQLRAAPRNEDEEREMDELRELERSVWLALTTRPIGVIGMTDNPGFFGIVNELLKRHSVDENGRAVKWSAKRVRDGYAEEVHVESGYSPRALQNAMVHAQIETSGRYLHQPRNDLREVGMLVRRLTGLLDDPKRAGNWPVRFAAAQERSAIQERRILVVAEGATWLETASPEARAFSKWIGTGQEQTR